MAKSKRLGGAERTVAPGDYMYQADPELYFIWGPAAVRAIERAIDSASELVPPKVAARGRARFAHILDFPCGYGRVLRSLKDAFPDAKLTAADISKEAVDFCAGAFEAKPLYSSEDLRQVQIDEAFDLIWCGSLFTHLDADRWSMLMDFFESHLRPWGLLVFTVHGHFYARRMVHDEQGMELGPEALGPFLDEFSREGFAYRDYPSQANYGISFSSPSWVCRFLESRPALRLVSYEEMGWNRTQDVVACTRFGPKAILTELLTAGERWTEQDLASVTRYSVPELRERLRGIGATEERDRGAPRWYMPRASTGPDD